MIKFFKHLTLIGYDEDELLEKKKFPWFKKLLKSSVNYNSGGSYYEGDY